MLYLHLNPLDTLLPPLTSSLPWSLPTYGPLAFVAHVDKLNLASPPPSLPPPPRRSLPTAWASFPPASLPSAPISSPEPWVVILLLQAPSEPQLRVFCSAESKGSELTQVEKEQAGELVWASVMEIKQRWKKGELMRVASVSSLWVDPLGVWKEGQKRVGVWLAPEGDLDGEEAGGIEDREESYRLVGGVEGMFVLRLGKEEDVGQIISTADRPHPRSSILPLLPFASVASFVTPTSATSAAWIVTKEDLSLGLLFTEINFRRLGLARRVVDHRIQASKTMGRPFCHVELDNEASSALWKGMGWELAWVVGWVYL